MTRKLTAKKKVEMQQAGIKFGCHVDLFDTDEPDACVKDVEDDTACIYAPRHRTREGCPYWREVKEAMRKAGEE